MFTLDARRRGGPVGPGRNPFTVSGADTLVNLPTNKAAAALCNAATTYD